MVTSAMTKPPEQESFMRLEQFSVERCKELIEKQPPSMQRRLDPVYVRSYARLMERGQWVDDLPGNVVVISNTGELIEGQHRCRSAILVNRSFGAWVSYGYETETIRKLGIVKPRTLSATLKMSGGDYSVCAAAAAKLFFNYLAGESPFTAIVMNSDDFDEVCREFPMFDDWVKEASRMYQAKSFRTAAPTTALLVYLYGRTCMMNAGVAARFWRQIETGADTAETTLLLRNMWLGFRGKRGNLEGKIWHHNTCVRAWERFRSGATGKTIVVPRDRLLEWR